ncbi:hypothetical protein [Lonsdalea britannica]|uniref:hypothetical protein n=1 Tax=Lonsdalea britannica TaxID=1082704 RepID=UPI0026EE131D|nr:hypothetical protein [Lonsdalea britannica]
MNKLTKDLKWSPDGCTIETISAGEYQAGDLPERAIAIAMQLGIYESDGADDVGADDGAGETEPAGKKTKK